MVDTAGRLQNKQGLMDELGKVKRVIEKQAPVTEVLLVLDATTGQNGMVQARVFSEVVNVTGIVLTKLDGTAKGGIVIAVQRQLGVPVKLVGLGEGPEPGVDVPPGGAPAEHRQLEQLGRGRGGGADGGDDRAVGGGDAARGGGGRHAALHVLPARGTAVRRAHRAVYALRLRRHHGRGRYGRGRGDALRGVRQPDVFERRAQAD